MYNKFTQTQPAFDEPILIIRPEQSVPKVGIYTEKRVYKDKVVYCVEINGEIYTDPEYWATFEKFIRP